MFRQYRQFNEDEFIVVGVDTAAGGSDYCAAQFLSVDNFDVPLVYHAKELASDMTPKLVRMMRDIYSSTGILPVVAYERNNGGVFEIERLNRYNQDKTFIVYQTKNNSASIRGIQSVKKYGWDTSGGTRPGMLADLKKVIDDKILTIYDLPTISELFSFVEQQTNNSWKAVAENGKHDDCFVKNTLVLTNKGQVPIQDIKVGDLVMTRAGYQPVLMTRSKRKRVIKKLGLTGSLDHPIITKRGEVPLSMVKDSDTLYIWNEKLSSITESLITDTLAQSADNIEFTTGDTINGKNHPLLFIGKSISIIMARFLNMGLSTMSTIIHSITISLTSDSLAELSTQSTICRPQSAERYRAMQQKSRATDSLMRLLNGAKITPNSHIGSIQKMAKNKLLVLSKHLKTGKETTPKKLINWQSRMGVRMSNICYRFVKRRVYNLQVANQPEYFANNILVHNCIMALAIAVQLSQTEQRNTDRTKSQVISELDRRRRKNEVYTNLNDEIGDLIGDSVKQSSKKNNDDWRYL